ncbi:unnamed protein product [Calicophoron daubneyi]
MKTLSLHQFRRVRLLSSWAAHQEYLKSLIRDTVPKQIHRPSALPSVINHSQKLPDASLTTVTWSKRRKPKSRVADNARSGYLLLKNPVTQSALTPRSFTTPSYTSPIVSITEGEILPLKAILNPKQTLVESIERMNDWFKDLDLNVICPEIKSSGNLAAYVPRSYTLTQLVKLGVDLSKIESVPGVANMLVKMDFHSSIEPVLWKLSDLGFSLNQIARVLTVFPKILQVPLGEIERRIFYFLERGFNQAFVVDMLHRYPLVLQLTSIEVDRQLGEVQTLFHLTVQQVRTVVTSVPNVILHPISKIKDNYVILTKMIGFSPESSKEMVLVSSKLLITDRERLLKNFAFMHSQLDLSLQSIQMWPSVLSAAPQILEQRATFLVRRGLFQPDPMK